MKKILMIVCLAFVCQAAIAQDDDDKKKKMEAMFGIAFGLNYAKIVGEHEDNDPRWGGQLGLYVALWQTQRMMLTTYLMYSMMGTKFSDDAHYALGYLILPIMFNYMLVQNLYFGLGIQPALLLSAKYKLNDQSTDIKDNLELIDVGIPAQLQYRFTRNFLLGLVITQGLTPIFKNGNKAKNFAGALRLVYNF